MKIYLIVGVWKSTKGNHAGMLHLARVIKKISDHQVSVLAIPTMGFRRAPWLYSMLFFVIANYLKIIVKKGDKIILMEYLFPGYDQSLIADMLSDKADVIGIAHLVPSRLEFGFSRTQIRKRIGPLSKLLVFGSSLQSYLISNGISNLKVKTTLHYADTEYYRPNDNLLPDHQSALKVLCVGGMERNNSKILRIISSSKKIQFSVCVGSQQLRKQFEGFQNVNIYGYISEKELLALMQSHHVSLNVMNDTIGSNVIATSLSTGMIVVASDVGSIRDYITDGENGFVAVDVEQFVFILEMLNEYREIGEKVRRSAIASAAGLTAERFLIDLETVFAEFGSGGTCYRPCGQ